MGDNTILEIMKCGVTVFKNRLRFPRLGHPILAVDRRLNHTHPLFFRLHGYGSSFGGADTNYIRAGCNLPVRFLKSILRQTAGIQISLRSPCDNNIIFPVNQLHFSEDFLYNDLFFILPLCVQNHITLYSAVLKIPFILPIEPPKENIPPTHRFSRRQGKSIFRNTLILILRYSPGIKGNCIIANWLI